MIYTSLPPPTDLAQTSLTIACQTDRCIYPEPQIAWYESNGSIYFNTNSSTLSSNSSTCNQSEQIYTSTLRIPLGSAFPGNVPMTKQLKCGALHPAINGTLFSQPSNDVIFAVSLTYINISGPTNVTNGTEVNFTCVTSVSRPVYTVNWRVGNTSITARVANFNRTTYAESRLTFVVDDMTHHDKEISCEVYTILATTVRSESRRLYVRVPIYSVSLSPANSTITAMEGSEKSFECNTSVGRPDPVVRWWLGNTQLFNFSRDLSVINGSLVSIRSVLNLPINRTQHNQTIFCQAWVTDQSTVVESSKPVFNVLYPPSAPMVKPFSKGFPWLENSTERLECFASDRGNPSSSVIWNTTRGTDDANQQRVIENLGANDNEVKVQCQLQNYYTMAKNISLISAVISLNVEYTPIITLNPPNTSVIINETSDLNITCSATGNPAPTSVSWVNRTPSSTSLYISNITRLNAGNYTCAAQSTSKSNVMLRMTRQVTVTVTVQYAPTISVKVVDLAPKERRILVQCSAQGVPAFYTFSSWVHMFKNVVVRSGLQGTEVNFTSVLNIYNASLEDKGSYFCSATNGIMGLNGSLYQSNAAYLDVKGSPNIFTEHQHFTGKIGQSVNISIQFYSYPSLSNITIKRNGIIINDTGRITKSEASYNFTMYNKTVQLDIQMAYFITSDLREEDFGKYTLDFTNELGTAEFIVDLYAWEDTGVPVGSIVGGVLGSVASLTVTAIIVFVLKRKGFQLNHRKVISYIQGLSAGKIEPEYANTVLTGTEYANAVTSTNKEKIYEDLRKRRSSECPYYGFQGKHIFNNLI
ncbi:hypothetical protein ACJMK2_024804 [Sinanodonta woodiana]|uniref:Ig-like domain-containing protein n=1 Tax=Sinanodonta woodiana TaxID=1069815 RepID=A0ABD3XI47_SINWO